MARKSKEPDFEEAMAELEQLVQELENGEPSLKELMEKYKRGVELSSRCLTELDEAEKAMETVLREHNGELVEQTLDIE